MTLRLHRSIQISAPVEKVFRAWMTADALAAWFAPMAVEEPKIVVDFQDGGAYEIVMNLGGDHVHTTRGKFREIVPNEKIVMTWHCDAFAEPETLVTVTFASTGNGTEVLVVHEKFVTEEGVAGHAGGWEACLQGLKQYSEGASA